MTQRAHRLPTAHRLVWTISWLLAAASALSASSTATAQAELRIERFGVGSVYRPGDPTAIRVAVTWRGLEPQPAQLVWEVENADGDVTEQVRTVVLNPGQPTTRWLYGRPGPRTEPQSIFTVRAFAEEEGRRGAELGVARFSPTTAAASGVAVRLEQRLYGVLGDGRMGLDGYSTALPTLPMAVASHEMTRIASALDARELPDRWEGLASYESLFWTTAAPQQLGLDEADALREWIRRGGHLVIVLPQSGNPWGLGAPPSHPLHDLLPTRAPERVEGVRFARVVDLLSKSPTLLNERAATTLAVWDSARLDRGWEPLMAVPAPRDEVTRRPLPGDDGLGGAIVGIQRTLGFGQMTMLGIDVDAANRLRLQPGIFPQADAFWNRVLGRRCDSPSPADIMALESVTPQAIERITTDDSLGGGSLVAGPIAMSGEAAVGTLAALALFTIYWILAGPGGFALLRARRMSRHAWVAFVATAVVFTVIAWVGSAAMRQGNVRVQHVTVLDHISTAGGAGSMAVADDPQLQRAWTWFSAYLPGYGPTRLSVDGPAGVRNLLMSWMPPPSGVPQRFPNTDRYPVPLGSPADYRVPARATAVQMETRWMGTVDPSWGRMPMAIDGAPVVERVRWEAEPSVTLTGQLRHDLPGTLRDVAIIHITSMRTPLRAEMPPTASKPAPTPQLPGELLNLGYFAVRSQWEPGEVLDLGAELYRDGPRTFSSMRSAVGDGFARLIAARFAAELSTRSGLATEVTLSPERVRRATEALSLFSLLPPPPWVVESPTRRPTPVFGAPTPQRVQRVFGRDLDLAPWFGRPCVIVIGFLDGSESPVPISVNGAVPPSSGRTIVRWICPLPIDPDLIVAEPRHRHDDDSDDS